MALSAVQRDPARGAAFARPGLQRIEQASEHLGHDVGALSVRGLHDLLAQFGMVAEHVIAHVFHGGPFQLSVTAALLPSAFTTVVPGYLIW